MKKEVEWALLTTVIVKKCIISLQNSILLYIFTIVQLYIIHSRIAYNCTHLALCSSSKEWISAPFTANFKNEYRSRLMSQPNSYHIYITWNAKSLVKVVYLMWSVSKYLLIIYSCTNLNPYQFNYTNENILYSFSFYQLILMLPLLSLLHTYQTPHWVLLGFHLQTLEARI